MLGLLGQLKKLVTFVVNLPQVITLIPKLTDSKELSRTLALGSLESEQLQGVLDQLSKVADAQFDFINKNEAARIQEIQNSNMSNQEKEEKIAEVREQMNVKRERVLDGIENQKSTYVESQVGQTQKAIEPSITTALAPLTLLIGIPTALKKISEITSNATANAALLNDRGINSPDGTPYAVPAGNITETAISPDTAEAGFQAGLSTAGFKGTYIGKKTLSEEREDNEDILKVYSQEPIVEFKYDTAGDLINSINYISINDDEVTDDPEFQVNFIGSSPSDLQNKFTIRLTDISKTTAGIEIRTPDTEPNYDGILTVEVQGNKINRRRFRGDTTTRASNTFTIPVRFTSTFGGEDPTTITSTSNTSSTSTSSTNGTNTE